MEMGSVCAHGIHNRSIYVIFAFIAMAVMMLIGTKAPPMEKLMGNLAQIISRDEDVCKDLSEIDEVEKVDELQTFFGDNVTEFKQLATEVMSMQRKTKTWYQDQVPLFMWQNLQNLSKWQNLTTFITKVEVKKREALDLTTKVVNFQKQTTFSYCKRKEREEKKKNEYSTQACKGRKKMENVLKKWFAGMNIWQLGQNLNQGLIRVNALDAMRVIWPIDFDIAEASELTTISDEFAKLARRQEIYRIPKSEEKQLPKPKKNWTTFASCKGLEDIYVKTFDGKHIGYYSSGDYYIVKHDLISIQGRYLPTNFTTGLPVTTKLAIGGKLLQDNKLIISPSSVTWNGRRILEGFSSRFHRSGLLTVDYGKPSNKRTVYVNITDCLPEGLNVQVNRSIFSPGNGFLTWRISMHSRDGQDGYCGNFNGNPADDDRHTIRQRKTFVPTDPELLFESKMPDTGPNLDDINNCPTATLEKATEECRKRFDGYSCLADYCKN